MEPVYFLLAYLLLPQRCYNAVDWLHKYRSSTTRNRQSSGLDANPSDRRDAARYQRAFNVKGGIHLVDVLALLHSLC